MRIFSRGDKVSSGGGLSGTFVRYVYSSGSMEGRPEHAISAIVSLGSHSVLLDPAALKGE